MHTNHATNYVDHKKKVLNGVLFLCMHVVLFLWSSGSTWQWLLELCYKSGCIINVFRKMEGRNKSIYL